MAYPFDEIETRWQQHWREHETFRTPGPGDPGQSKRNGRVLRVRMLLFAVGALVALAPQVAGQGAYIQEGVGGSLGVQTLRFTDPEIGGTNDDETGIAARAALEFVGSAPVQGGVGVSYVRSQTFFSGYAIDASVGFLPLRQSRGRPVTLAVTGGVSTTSVGLRDDYRGRATERVYHVSAGVEVARHIGEGSNGSVVPSAGVVVVTPFSVGESDTSAGTEFGLGFAFGLVARLGAFRLVLEPGTTWVGGTWSGLFSVRLLKEGTLPGRPRRNR